MKAIAAIAIVAMSLAPIPAQGHTDGRWVNFGKWAPIIRCESGGNAQATNRSSGADGAYQFLQSTWDNMHGAHSWPEGRRYRPRMIGRAPSSFTLAQQMRAAETLRVRVVGGGMSHWTCHTMGHRYGSTPGNNLVWVTGEVRSKSPRWCARNLHRNWGRSWKVAKSVCGVAR